MSLDFLIALVGDRVPLEEVLSILHRFGLELFIFEGNSVQKHELFSEMVISMFRFDVSPLCEKALIGDRFPMSVVLLELFRLGAGTNAIEVALDSMDAAGVVESSADEDGVLVRLTISTPQARYVAIGN